MDIFLSIARNGALLLSLSFLYSLFIPYLKHKPRWMSAIITGVLFGSFAVLNMLEPMRLSNGVIIDPRNVILMVASVVSGFRGGFVAFALVASYRIYLNGDAMWAGLASMLTAVILGLFYHSRRKEGQSIRLDREIILVGILVAVESLLWTLVLPNGYGWTLMPSISLPVLIIYPLVSYSLIWLIAYAYLRLELTAALEESEARFRTIIDAAPMGIAFSRDGLILYENRKYLEMFGYQRPEEMNGRPLIEQIAPLYRDEIVDRGRRQDAGEAVPTHYETVGVRRDGSQFPFEIWLSTMDFEDGHAKVGFHLDVTERKHADAALHESVQRYRTLMENLYTGIIVHTPDGRRILYNKQANQLLGTDSAQGDAPDFSGRYWHYIQSDGSRLPQDQYPFYRVLNTGEPVRDFEIGVYRQATNDQIWVLVNAFPEFDQQNHLKQIVVTYTDITVQVLSAERLAEQKYQLTERIKELNCLYSHARLVDEPGLSLDSLCQGTVDLMPAAWQYPDITCARLVVENRVYTNANFKETPWQMTSDVYAGQEYSGRLQVCYLEEKPGAIEGPFLTEERLLINELARRLGQKIEAMKAQIALHKAHDTLEERVIQRTAQLQAAKERVEAILNSSVDGILLAQSDFTIERTNAAFDQLFNCETDAYVHQPFRDLLLPEPDDATFLSIQSQVGKQKLYREIHACRRDGSVFEAEISIGCIKNEGFVCVIRDITERKMAEEALRQALATEKELGELKSRFVSMASHEFRTPLATIMAFTESLSLFRHKLTNEQIDKKLNNIRAQVEHLKNIMDDVLLLARMQARRVEFNPEKVNLDGLCQSILHEFKSRPDVRHSLNYVCDPAIDEVMLDRRLIRQIISNLLANAIKYSPEEQPIELRLSITDTEYLLTVRDYGIGIPEADLKHLFQPFHRASNVGTISGTGLGLVIVKDSVELHGGTISVESVQGEGSLFTVRLLRNMGDMKDAKDSGH